MATSFPVGGFFEKIVPLGRAILPLAIIPKIHTLYGEKEDLVQEPFRL